MRPEEPWKQKDLPEAAGKTESFFTRNVRVITFLICIAVFLAFFGPVSVFTVGKIIEKRTNQKQAMTVEESLKLAENPDEVTFDLLRRYEGRFNETETMQVYYIEFDCYLILAAQNKEKGILSVFLENLDSGVRINFLKDDVRAFFDGTLTRQEENAA